MRVVSFSGGLDSTKILLDLAREMNERDINDIENILLISANIEITGSERNKREFANRTKIIEKVQKMYPRARIYRYELDISENKEVSYNINFEGRGLSQPIFWLTGLIPIVANNSIFYMGYLHDDQALIKIHSIVEAFKYLCDINNLNAKIEFPLIYQNKRDIIEWFIDNKLVEFFDLCTYCESNEDSDCCSNCISCESFINALIELLIAADKKSYKYKQYKSILEKKHGIIVPDIQYTKKIQKTQLK